MTTTFVNLWLLPHHGSRSLYPYSHYHSRPSLMSHQAFHQYKQNFLPVEQFGQPATLVLAESMWVLSSTSKLGSEGRNARLHPRCEALRNTSRARLRLCRKWWRATRWNLVVLSWRIFICRRWICLDILDLPSLLDTVRGMKLDEYMITTFTLPKFVTSVRCQARWWRLGPLKLLP
jgi:hypothetical protein